jgi:hypothetical protein
VVSQPFCALIGTAFYLFWYASCFACCVTERITGKHAKRGLGGGGEKVKQAEYELLRTVRRVSDLRALVVCVNERLPLFMPYAISLVLEVAIGNSQREQGRAYSSMRIVNCVNRGNSLIVVVVEQASVLRTAVEYQLIQYELEKQFKE